MKVTIKQLLEARGMLERLGQEKMSALSAYRLQRNISKINPELEGCRVFITHLSEKHPNGDAEGMKEYNRELQEFLESEIEIDILQIKLEDIKAEFTPFELMAISWLFTE